MTMPYVPGQGPAPGQPPPQQPNGPQQPWQQMPVPGSVPGPQQQQQNPVLPPVPTQYQQPPTEHQYRGEPQQWSRPPEQPQPVRDQFGNPVQQPLNQYGQPTAPQYGIAPQQQPQAPQYGQPQQPAQQPAQRALVWQDAQGRLYGEGLPQQAQGMTLQQIQQMQRMPQSQFAPQQPFQSQQPQQPQMPQQQAPQQPQPEKSFWADPRGVIEEVVDKRIGPILQQSTAQQVQSIRQQMRQAYPNFAEYEQEVVQQLAGTDPQLQADPRAWEYAFQRAVGARILAGGAPAQGGFQQFQAPPAQQPVVPAGAFFSESPSSGYIPGQNPADGTFGLSPSEMEAARRFGMSAQEYARGKGMNV